MAERIISIDITHLVTAALEQQRESDDRTNIGRNDGDRPISVTSSDERDDLTARATA